MKRTFWIALMVSSVTGASAAQTVIDESKLIRPAQVQATLPAASPSAPLRVSAYTIPAGTTILARLISPLHTTSATVGSGIYMETKIPVVVGDRVVVPAGSSIVGTIEHDQRPGRVSGRAQFRFQMHTIILPNNHMIDIAGSLQGVPGSSLNRRIDRRGTTEPVDQIDRDARILVRGPLIGAFLGAVIGRSPTGVIAGSAAGGAAGIAKVLFTRGDEIQLLSGTTVEIVLDRAAKVEARYVP